MIVNNIQLRPKRCLLVPLARVGARTESTTYNARRGQFPCTRIGVVHKELAFAPRVLHFSAFYYPIFSKYYIDRPEYKISHFSRNTF